MFWDLGTVSSLSVFQIYELFWQVLELIIDENCMSISSEILVQMFVFVRDLLSLHIGDETMSLPRGQNIDKTK